MKQSNAGVALINALIIVAVIAFVAVSLLEQAQRGQKSIERIYTTDQTALMLDAGLEDAKILLAHLPATDPVHTGQDWAAPRLRIKYHGSTIERHISDLQGRFNINTLLNDKDSTMRAVFSRLAASQSLPQGAVTRFIDTLTPETDSTATAKPLFIHPRQLRQFFPGNGTAFDRLLPWLAALPTTTRLNANTITPELWKALLPEFDGTARSKLTTYLRKQPVKGGAELVSWAQTDLGEEAALALEALNLEGQSTWFEVDLVAHLDNDTLGRSAVLNIDSTQQQAIVIFSIPTPD